MNRGSPSRPFTVSSPRPILALAILSAVASCASDPSTGYTFRTSHRQGVRSISVPMFENRTFHKGLEAHLTDAVIKEMQRSTPWAVSGAGSAQTTLEGTIASVELRPLSTGRDSGMVQEMAVRITVDFAWRDNATGNAIVERRGFSASESFVPARPAAEPLALGEYAAAQQLARDIVAEMRSDW